MRGMPPTAPASPLRARLTRERKRRRLTSVSSIMAQLLDPADQRPRQHDRAKRRQCETRQDTKPDQSDSARQSDGPHAGRRQMNIMLVHATSPNKYTRLKMIT